MDKKEILEVLQQVYDPDYVDRSIVDMGLVTEDDIIVKDNSIEVAYSLTAPMCPCSAAIGVMIKYALEKKLFSTGEREAKRRASSGGGRGGTDSRSGTVS